MWASILLGTIVLVLMTVTRSVMTKMRAISIISVSVITGMFSVATMIALILILTGSINMNMFNGLFACIQKS